MGDQGNSDFPRLEAYVCEVRVKACFMFRYRNAGESATAVTAIEIASKPEQITL